MDAMQPEQRRVHSNVDVAEVDRDGQQNDENGDEAEEAAHQR